MPSSRTAANNAHCQRINHLRLLLRRQELLTFQFRFRTAEVCLSIAADTVDTIYATHNSPIHQELERYSDVIYLTGAIVPLASIVICKEMSSSLKQSAKQAFDKAISILRDISPGLALARNNLKKLVRITSAVEKASLKPSANGQTAVAIETQFEVVANSESQNPIGAFSSSNLPEQGLNQLPMAQVGHMDRFGDDFVGDEINFGFPRPIPLSPRDMMCDTDLINILTWNQV